jgi:hypothetical protein
MPTLRGLIGKQSPVLMASTVPQIMKPQLHSIEDEATGIEDDEGEDIIKSINSLINQGKQNAACLQK